jgi:hypothetical protein
MRRTTLLLPALLVLPLLGSDSPKDYDDRAQEDGIEGVWQLVRTEVGGVARDEQPGQFYTYRVGKFVWPAGPTTGTYSVDSSFQPPRLTENAPIGETRNIFQIRGVTLRVAQRKFGEGYPQGFDDRKNLIVGVFKRVR